MIPGCVGKGVRLGSESSSSGGAAAAGGVWKSANLEISEFGDLVTWNSEIWGPTNQKNNTILKRKIRVAQKAGKFWISRKKSSRSHFMTFQAIFCVGRKNRKKCNLFAYFCYFTGLGLLLLSTRGGAIGIYHHRKLLTLSIQMPLTEEFSQPYPLLMACNEGG